MLRRPDIMIADFYGASLIMTGVSAAGTAWLEENLANAIRHRAGFLVEQRHVKSIV